jgi:hypothetical protein
MRLKLQTTTAIYHAAVAFGKPRFILVKSIIANIRGKSRWPVRQ